MTSYAQAYDYNPDQWSFLTGELGQIRKMANLLGLSFETKKGSILHNLRTVVIDRDLRLYKVYKGNRWKPSDVVGDILKASGYTNSVAQKPVESVRQD